MSRDGTLFFPPLASSSCHDVFGGIDTTTAHGRLFFHLMASLSEYERDLIRDRCSAGKSQAIVNGVKFGRPRIHIDIDRVNDMILAGLPKTTIARKLKISYRGLTSRITEHRKNVNAWEAVKTPN